MALPNFAKEMQNIRKRGSLTRGLIKRRGAVDRLQDRINKDIQDTAERQKLIGQIAVFASGIQENLQAQKDIAEGSKYFDEIEYAEPLTRWEKFKTALFGPDLNKKYGSSQISGRGLQIVGQASGIGRSYGETIAEMVGMTQGNAEEEMQKLLVFGPGKVSRKMNTDYLAPLLEDARARMKGY